MYKKFFINWYDVIEKVTWNMINIAVSVREGENKPILPNSHSVICCLYSFGSIITIYFSSISLILIRKSFLSLPSKFSYWLCSWGFNNNEFYESINKIFLFIILMVCKTFFTSLPSRMSCLLEKICTKRVIQR